MTSRIVRALLRLAPGWFRDRYEADLLDVHHARVAARRGGGVGFAVREVAGTLWLVTKLHLSLERQPGTGRGGAGMWEKTRQDLRFALKTLWRAPGFSLTALVVLGLGIGATTAIFSAANAFFFRPLPFAEADRLVHFFETNPEFGWTDTDAAPANVLDWREQVDAITDIATYSPFENQVTIQTDGRPELVDYSQVSGNFFDVLGVVPALGRGFRDEETWSGADDVVVLAHHYWVARFGADPSIVGTVQDFGSFSVEVVGVAPEGFAFPYAGVDFWTPWGWDAAAREAGWFRRAHFVRPIGRLAPGVTLEEADAQLQTVVQRLSVEYPEFNRVMGAGFMPVREFLVRNIRSTVLIIFGAVSLLLLIACTNVANLMLVRAGERSREVALRFAMGAGRARIARQLVTESLVLSLGGGVLGLAVGWLGIRLISARTAIGIDGATELALDYRVVLFGLAVSVVAGLVFGAYPAFKVARGDLQQSLKEGGRAASAGRSGVRASNLLVTAQVAVALLLAVGAGLMVRSSMALRSVDLGFDTDNVFTAEFTVPSVRYSSRDEVLTFWDDFTFALEQRPGVRAVGTVGGLPLSGTSWSSDFTTDTWPADRYGVQVLHRRADAAYFEALGIPLLRGRLFESTDGPDDPLVVVINETLAETYFADSDPIGQRIAYDRNATEESYWYEIIGVVGDQQQVDPRSPARPEIFENRSQDWSRTLKVVMASSLDPATAEATLRSVLAEKDPMIPVVEARSMRTVWKDSMAREEAMLGLLTIFGVMALVLSSVGLYGVTAQAARKRTQEIGIRMALGARAGDVLGMMLRQGLSMVGLGLVLGILGAVTTTRAISSFLFQVEAVDGATYGAVGLLLSAVAACAIWFPARRATRVDPASSLRSE